jgi:hypothetical protein
MRMMAILLALWMIAAIAADVQAGPFQRWRERRASGAGLFRGGGGGGCASCGR